MVGGLAGRHLRRAGGFEGCEALADAVHLRFEALPDRSIAADILFESPDPIMVPSELIHEDWFGRRKAAGRRLCGLLARAVFAAEVVVPHDRKDATSVGVAVIEFGQLYAQ